VQRTDWGIFTSRRFCQVCESEYKGHDLIPRAIVIGGIAIGIFGFGSYLRSGASTEPRVTRLVTRPSETDASPPGAEPKAPAANRSGAGDVNAAVIEASKPPQQASNTGRDARIEVAAASEQLYYCGARTKKGTPCSRRVKGNFRCYQHAGMPAILPAEQLKVK